MLELGAEQAVIMGFGSAADLQFIESTGRLTSADPALVGERARLRGRGQLGTLGSGNHFLEIQAVDAVLDRTLHGDEGTHVLPTVTDILGRPPATFHDWATRHLDRFTV